MGWAVWLGIPAAATVLAALWTWLRARPPRQPSTAQAMREHNRYLDALAESARHAPREPGG